MKNMLVNELLERDNTILKSLHDAFDFDFNAEFDVVKISGRFTHKSILKTLNIKKCDNLNIVLVITDLKYQESNNYIVKMNDNNFCLSFPRKIYYGRVSWFWGVGQFEEVRKREEKTVYIVYQEKELSKKASYKKPDYTQRFCFVRSIGWSDGRGRHGISQFDVKDMQHNGRQINIKAREASASTDINYFIDKSGYLVEEKKLELKRRAKALKVERAKAFVDNINFNKEIADIETELKNINSHICFMMQDVNNYDSIKKVDDIITKLRWFYISFDNFKKANENKTFSNIENAKYKLNEIIKKLNDIHMMIK